MLAIRTALFLLGSFALLPGCSNHQAHEDHKDGDHHAPGTHEIGDLKIDNLLRDTLALRDGIEVIVSYVEVPKNTTLPYHYHPGEEFAYLIEGSGELILKDKSTRTIQAGEAGKVPLKQVHTFSSSDQGARMVVFRVHEMGQPDRILVD